MAVIASGADIGETTKILNPRDRDAISIDDKTLFLGEIIVGETSGRVKIGQWCYIGPDTKIWTADEVTIGDRVFISHGVHIFDNNSHSLSASERHARYRELRLEGRHAIKENIRCSPIIVEDDVWIGFNVAILKGATLGRGAVVAAGAYVTKSVAPYTIVAGNPARVVGESQP